MRWQLAGDWPVGQFCIPAGTVLSSGAGEAPIWNGIALPMPPPINAVALDEDAALQMCLWYEESATIGGWHHLHFAPGIDRDAIMAKAAEAKRWPNGRPDQGAVESGPHDPREP
jgi:hypothetical protein